jgi:hypothetical protein
MSYNTIPLRREDLDRRPALYKKFLHGIIKPEEVVELKQILENERYIAIGEGDIPVVLSITTIISDINEYMEKKGISKFENIKVGK